MDSVYSALSLCGLCAFCVALRCLCGFCLDPPWILCACLRGFCIFCAFCVVENAESVETVESVKLIESVKSIKSVESVGAVEGLMERQIICVKPQLYPIIILLGDDCARNMTNESMLGGASTLYVVLLMTVEAS